MNASRRCYSTRFAILMLTLFFTLVSAGQEPTQTTSASSSSKSSTATDDGWHIGVTPYIWFAAAHGTIGALGRDASFHASFGDIFSNLNIGLMGAFEARKKKLLLTTDFVWIKLSDDRALPVNEVGVQSIKAKATQFLLTPKAGYRVVNQERIKIDGQIGFRYWHLSNDFTLEPAILNGFSDSANWVDVVAGARIELPLTAKAKITVLGDGGGGGANLDYQVAGVLGYQVCKKCVLLGGWRYIDVDYRPSGRGFIYDVATTGPILGFTINLK